MNFIEGLVMGVMALRESKKTEKMEHAAASYQNQPQYDSFLSEKTYLKSKDKMISEIYKPFDLEFFNYEADLFERNIETIDGNSFSEDTKQKLSYLFTIVNADRNSLTKMCDLICELIKINKTAGEPTEHMLHNELLYVIDMYSPKNDVERMIQHLCIFLDAEYYFYQGNYINALKRFYKAIDWDKILLNGRIREIYDVNGLEEIYEASVMNIINTYALLGLSDKAEKTRKAFQPLHALMERLLFVDPQLSSDEQNSKIKKYQEEIKKTYLATNKLMGWFSFIDSAIDLPDMFYGCHLGNFGGDDRFSITMNFTSDIQEIDITGLREGKLGMYPGIRFYRYGYIEDYKYKADMQREEIAKLF